MFTSPPNPLSESERGRRAQRGGVRWISALQPDLVAEPAYLSLGANVGASTGVAVGGVVDCDGCLFADGSKLLQCPAKALSFATPYTIWMSATPLVVGSFR